MNSGQRGCWKHAEVGVGCLFRSFPPADMPYLRLVCSSKPRIVAPYDWEITGFRTVSSEVCPKHKLSQSHRRRNVQIEDRETLHLQQC